MNQNHRALEEAGREVVRNDTPLQKISTETPDLAHPAPRGLNFVFETGSGHRNGGHNVRSQAAKHGWTSRQRVSKREKPAKPKLSKAHGQSTLEGIFQALPPTIASSSNFSASGLLTPTASPSPQPRLSSKVLRSNTRRESTVSEANPLTSLHEGSSTAVTGESQIENSSRSDMTSPRAKRSTSPFLEIVLNEDYQLPQRVNDAGNPFGMFPVKWHPLYGSVVDRYRSLTAAQVREINSEQGFGISVAQLPLKVSVAEGESALFFAIMATTSAMLARGGSVMGILPQFFQSKTVEALNTALADPMRAFSSAAILTVSLIALFESTSGHAEQAANIHQPALRKMTEARGGLIGLYHLDTHGRALVSFLVWCDRVISSQCGNALVFPDYSDESMEMTSWNDVWSRMKKHIPEQKNLGAPLENGMPP